MEKLVYSIPEVAELLGISKPTAYALIKTFRFYTSESGR